MSKETPTIDNAWAAFETDLTLNGCSASEIEFFKLVWMGGAMAMGVILASKENTPDDKVAAFRGVAAWLSGQPHFARLAVRLAELRDKAKAEAHGTPH